MKLLLSAFILATSFSASAITIGAYNIRNFDYDQRYRISTDKNALSTMLKSLNVDVLAIEEINNTGAWEKFVQNSLPGHDTELTRCGGSHGQRLGFLYNKNKVELLSFNEDLNIVNPGAPGTCDSGSRPLAIGLFRIKATGQRFYGMAAHLKSGSQSSSVSKRAAQYKIIKETILELKAKTGVKDYFVAGDLNTTEYTNNGPDFKALNKVTNELGMINLTSNVKCTAYYWGGTDDGIETPSKLDHVIATPGLVRSNNPQVKVHGHCQAVSCREVPIENLGNSYASLSDHCPITATIQ
jgi:endonuclease/exonuclease/phosphatase family metal-dependent hydrolase